MTSAFESPSLQSAEAWPAESAAASHYPNAISTGENALGNTQDSFEQILQATFETLPGAAMKRPNGDASVFTSGTTFQNGFWNAVAGVTNGTSSASNVADEQAASSATAASAVNAKQRNEEIMEQRRAEGKASAHRTSHVSTLPADGDTAAGLSPSLPVSSTAVPAESPSLKGEPTGLATGFDKLHNAMLKSSPNSAAGNTGGDVAFAMRISPDKTALADARPGPDNANDGSGSPLTPVPLAADAGFATTLLVISQPEAQAAAANGTAVYLQAPGQPDRTASETDGAEQAQPTVLDSTEIVSDGQPASSEPVRSVRLQLAGENEQRVDVRLVEQGGSLALSVRSTDSALTRTLQDRLPELNDRLSEQHYQSEVWLPQGASVAATINQGQGQESSGGQHDSQHSGSNHSGSNQSGSNQSNSKQSGSEDGGKQFGSGSQNGSTEQQNGRQDKAPKWYQRLTAFENQTQS